MDEHIPTRDRLYFPHMEEPPGKKRRVGDHQSTGSPSIIDTIVNATSSWPLNSLNSSSVLPTYEESMAASHTNYLPYFDREHYVNTSNSPSKERSYTMVDNVPRVQKSVPLPREEYPVDPSYRTHQIYNNQTFNEEYTTRIENIPYSNHNVTPPGFTTDSPNTAKDKLSYTTPEKSAHYNPSTTHTLKDIMPKTKEIFGDEHAKEQSVSIEPRESRKNYEKRPNIQPNENLSNKKPSDSEAELKPEEISIKVERESSIGSPQSSIQDCMSTGFKMAEDAPTFTSPPVQNSSDTFDRKSPDASLDIKKEKEDVNDMYSFLDWKDGIATLPGSNLKFKLNEFGTLEMVSTVETEKGEYEWSTAAQSSSDLMSGPPDDGNVLCCEVCGIYGLPQDFCSSGRFCSLSCVGSYTGKRNKGREFIRNVNPIEKKVSKKKKKGGKVKKGTSSVKSVPSPDGEDSGFMDGPSETQVASFKLKSPREKGKGRHKIPPIEATGQCLTASMVPYNFSKPFTWTDYLYSSGSKPVPVNVFKQENPEIDVFPMPCQEFKKNMKLEAVDPKHPSYICVCTIVRVKGSRLRLHFDGWSECYDFWTNADSPDIFPVGWCEQNKQTLHPPRSFTKGEFNWSKYLKKQGRNTAPAHLFQPITEKKHNFEIGMKLEAIDRKNPDLICVATVTNVIGNRFLVHFDEWDDTYDYWCEEDCPYIHPIGWCESTGRRLTPPNDDEVNTFTWNQYLKTTGTTAAPPELFKTRTLPTFKVYQKLEAVDKRNPSLIRSATVAQVLDYRVRVHFDGWDNVYDDWFDADSTDLHPVGYCEKTGHPLEPPLTTADKISSVACPTPGCKGIGHVKGAKYSSHHSTFGCPYSLQNLNKESCLVDRLSTNSMTEESDWSYASKNKTTTVSSKRGESVSSLEAVCLTPDNDGKGNISGRYRTHQSSAGIPKNEANIIKIPRPPIPIQPAPLKETPTTSKKKVAAAIVTTSGTSKAFSTSTAPVARRHTKEIKKEKSSASDKIQLRQISPKAEQPTEKMSQQTTGYGQQWKENSNNFEPIQPANEARKKSRERLRMSRWSIDDVVKHVTSLGCKEQAKLFEEQKIDGESFLLLTQDDIVNILKIKLGPALKIFKSIPKV